MLCIFKSLNLVWFWSTFPPNRSSFSLLFNIDLYFIYQIVRVELQGAAAFLYSRLVPLVLLLVEGKWRLWKSSCLLELLILISLYSRFHTYRYWRAWMGIASGSEEDSTWTICFKIWIARLRSCPLVFSLPWEHSLENQPGWPSYIYALLPLYVVVQYLVNFLKIVSWCCWAIFCCCTNCVCFQLNWVVFLSEPNVWEVMWVFGLPGGFSDDFAFIFSDTGLAALSGWRPCSLSSWGYQFCCRTYMS
jgi:hypothetical protein